MTDLATLVVRLEAETSQYQTQLAAATKQLADFQSSVGQSVKAITETLGEAFAVDKIEDFIQSSVESAASLQKLSEEVGVSVDQLSAFGAVAAQAGVGQDDMTTSLKKLNQAISQAAGDPTSKAADAFKALGISVTNADGSIKGAGDILPEIATSYSQLADGANKVSINTQLLGKSSLALIPTLNQGASALADMEQAAIDSGQTLSGPLAEAADALEKKFIGLKQSFTTTLSADVLTALLPTLNSFADGLNNIAKSANTVSSIFTPIEILFNQIGAAFLSVTTQAKALGSAFDTVGALTTAALSGNWSQISAINQKGNADQIAIYKAGATAIGNILSAGSPNQVAAAQAAADAAKAASDAANTALSQGVSPELLSKQDDATKKVQDFADSLKTQAASFDLGSTAATNFKLQTGALGTALALAKKNLDDTAGSTNAGAIALHASAQAALDAAAAAQKYSAILQQKQDTKEVTDYTDKLQDQVLKLGESDIAAVDFATSTGKLGQALSDLGAQGVAATGHIHDLAVELTDDKDKDALVNVNSQIESVTGNLVDAAAAAFDFQNKLLIKNVSAVGGGSAGQVQLDALKQLTVTQQQYNAAQATASDLRVQEAAAETSATAGVVTGQISVLQGQQAINDARTTESQQLATVTPIIAAYQQQQIDALKTITLAQAQYNQLQQQATAIRTAEAAAESDINNQVASGQTTQIDGQKDIAALRTTELGQLTDIYTQLQAINGLGAQPTLVNGVKQFGTALKDLQTSAIDPVAQKLRTDFISSASDAFAAFVTGTETAKQALQSFLTSFVSEISKLASQNLLESLLGGGPSSTGGRFFSLLSSFFGGGGQVIPGVNQNGGVGGGIGNIVGSLAGGGPVQAGSNYIVGEHGAEEFMPSVDGHIVPNSQMNKATNVYQTFVLPAGSQISRQTQQQVGAQASTGLTRAARRNT